MKTTCPRPGNRIRSVEVVKYVEPIKSVGQTMKTTCPRLGSRISSVENSKLVEPLVASTIRCSHNETTRPRLGNPIRSVEVV